MKNIVIIDYGAGNIGSIENMLLRLGYRCKITSDPDEIKKANKLILPGVGSFDFGMKKLNESGISDVLGYKVNVESVPILGICLGAQLMTNSSEEGQMEGLKWFDAQVVKFSNQELRVPHMGWNTVTINKSNHLSKNFQPDNRFYFVHSYYIKANYSDDVIFTTKYGVSFVSGLNKGNIYAVQFHPEKSHKFGIQLFQNFLAI